MNKNIALMDGNEAAAYVAHKVSEVCAIYPITPSSNMGEFADQWSAEGRKNIWGTVPLVVELQSEGGASGSIHGAAQTGALTATFTASQGLLLMIPNMFKIAGELTSTVLHVSARTVATHALSIFGDHSDVMATRSTGFALLSAASVQQAMDMAMIAHAATLESRLPFLHFFDGFRTSHEVNKIEILTDDQIRAMINEEKVREHRMRALNPERPVLRGTAQNPDAFFQAREACNPFYAKCPDIVQSVMDRFAKVVGRSYRLFDYYGAPNAEHVAVLMGSGAETALETVDYLNARGGRFGVINVHLYRPFSVKHLLAALPKTVKGIVVLDRTKEPGAEGEPLYKDVVTSLTEAAAAGTLPMPALPRIIGGRYGLSCKEFTPAQVKACFDEIQKPQPKNHFTVGIRDDVMNLSLEVDPHFITESDKVTRAMFFGLGADGTVGANKNSIKIIGEETDFYAQGYFVYDSKKAGSRTVSHLRFGPEPIHSTYLIQSANFIGCHQFVFLQQTDVLKYAAEGAVFLLNSPFGPDEVWNKIPRKVQQQIIAKKLRFYVIDGYKVARETGMGGRINTIMQTCFFAISGVLPREEAIEQIKKAIRKTYGKKGEDVVKKNFEAVDRTLENLKEVHYPQQATSPIEMPPVVSPKAPEFVQKVTAEIMAGRGDDLPVSAMPVDGTFPTGTAKWEKRNISLTVPAWDPSICTQCGNCAFVCPHSCIRMKYGDVSLLKNAPKGFKHTALKGKDIPETTRYMLQVAVEDCTGCGLCVEACPAKNKVNPSLRAINMADKLPILEQERENLEFFESLPLNNRAELDLTSVRGIQFTQPLFEYSGACAGCGETPYVKLLTQLFGDRAIIANATGCSSIYGGNLPTTPYTVNPDGRGPAWSNSLFEDNAEFGYGFRLTIDKLREFASELLRKLESEIGTDLVQALINAPQTNEKEIAEQRARVAQLREKLRGITKPEARQLEVIADHLVKRSIWLVGGDGWAYDIGYGGLDHVLASGRNVNILVLDTEVYSNTGGQMSKATPRGAVAKFAAAGKPVAKKDLGMMAMCYGSVYVARVSMGANPRQLIRAFLEAEAYDGPSLIIAYSHCIAHGINMVKGLEQQKLAVNSAYWPLYRYNPLLAKEGKNPLVLDSKPPAIPLKDYAYNEVRYRMLVNSHPEVAEMLIKLAQADVKERWKMYEDWAARQVAPLDHTM
jgi:pyruvate-ferredoxin/flavodoxin oxidoreductase